MRSALARVARINVWVAVGLIAFTCLVGRSAHADVAPRDGDRPRSVTAAEEAPTGEELPEQRETPQIHPKSLALQLVNFGVLLFILIKFGGPAIGKALAARHEQLKAELAAAAEARAAALARLEQQDKRLAALEQEIVDIRGGIAQEAEAEKARLIALAEERSRRIREETSFAIPHCHAARRCLRLLPAAHLGARSHHAKTTFSFSTNSRALRIPMQRPRNRKRRRNRSRPRQTWRPSGATQRLASLRGSRG